MIKDKKEMNIFRGKTDIMKEKRNYNDLGRKNINEAPNLEFNSNKMPFINSFFNEISLDDEIDKITDNMENKKEKEKIKHKDKKEQLEKENLKN